MKNIKYRLIALLIAPSTILFSCSDFMDITPTNEYTEEAVFLDAGLTQAFIDRIYGYVQSGAKEHTLDGLTDDAYFTHNYGQVAVNTASISESDLQWYKNGNNPFKWDDRYKGIRYANIVIANIDKVPPKQGYNIESMKGEVYFLRAYLYAELVRGYGGVPIIDKPYGIDQIEEMKIPRNNIGECLDFIVKDCEEAEKYLPKEVSESELGKATKGAATALKARMLLHVASPLYADRTVNTLAVNQYDGDRKALYKAALSAADQVINNGMYELIDCRGGVNTERAVKFNSIITKNNKEQIFTRQFGSLGDWNRMGLWHGPNGYHNWAGTTPTQDLVMAFEFEDGTLPQGMTKPGEWQKGNPYNGREPRFYATVATDGNEWGRPRPADAQSLDPTPLGQLQSGFYEMTDGEATLEVNLPDGTHKTLKGMWGIDTRKGPIEDWNGSWTGYYEKKLIDPTIDAQSYPQEVPWTYIRLAEMYLTAAEACVELNKLDKAAEYLDAVRGRIELKNTKEALIAQGKSFNQENMREFVRHERRVEFAYENFRYYDVRRWMIAPVTNNKKLTGIEVFGLLKPQQKQTKPYIHDETKYTYYYIVTDLYFREERKWDNKMYFAPIPREERKRNPKLEQNPGME